MSSGSDLSSSSVTVAETGEETRSESRSMGTAARRSARSKDAMARSPSAGHPGRGAGRSST
eukprot:5833093-Lingulodinium_polyedra.AAC.1